MLPIQCLKQSGNTFGEDSELPFASLHLLYGNPDRLEDTIRKAEIRDRRTLQHEFDAIHVSLELRKQGGKKSVKVALVVLIDNTPHSLIIGRPPGKCQTQAKSVMDLD